MGKASEVKQYARIIYAVDGEEHSAVALSVPNVAYHSGNRQGSCYINLVYLDPQGNPVKIVGAPLLTEAATPEELSEFARLTVDGVFGKPRTDHEVEVKSIAYSQERRRIEKEKRTVGWKPMGVEGKDAAPESLVSAFLRMLRDPIIRAYTLDPGNEEEIYAALGLEKETRVPIEGTLDDGKPTADDLDKVVQELAVASATSSIKEVDFSAHEQVHERNAGVARRVQSPVEQARRDINGLSDGGDPPATVDPSYGQRNISYKTRNQT